MLKLLVGYYHTFIRSDYWEPINSKPSIKSGNDPYVELSAQVKKKNKENVARIGNENVAFPMMADTGSK